MPMMTWLLTHPFENAHGWMWWVVVGLIVACIIAILYIFIKYR